MKGSLLRSTLALGAALVGFSVNPAHAAWTYSSPTAQGACSPLDSTGTSSDFSITALVHAGVSQTLKMAFVMPSDTSTHPDIIFIQRTGEIKYYEALTGTVTTMGTVTNVSTATEDGLIGVAVEKPFKNRVYVSYAHQITSGASNTIISGSFRLSRFDLTAPGAKTLDMANEHVLLDVPSARNRWHTAGALAFDNLGNLYWAIGDNETTVTGPGNTHDLRGGILRIKPKEDGSGYTIPAGNFGDYWANKFQGQGRTALAAMYRDTSKVSPEIYIKGTRNAYVMNVDPYNGQVVYSQCGPDYGGTTEAWNNSRFPVFAGWPFWSGGTTAASSQVSGGQYGKNGSSEPTTATWNTYLPTDTLNPVNKWTANMAGAPTMGADTLPPLARSKYYLNHNTANCAMGSVMIRYDGRVKNPGKLPPQMNNVWLNGNYGSHITYAAKVDTNGNPSVPGVGTGAWNQIWGSFIVSNSAATFQAITDFKQGPDGAFYVNNYFCGSGTSAGAGAGNCGGIARIEYTGAACSDTALYPKGFVVGINNHVALRQSVDWLKVNANSFSVFANGPHTVQILDVNGRSLVSMKGDGRKDYAMPTLPKSGMYYLRVDSRERGTAVQAFTRF